MGVLRKTGKKVDPAYFCFNSPTLPACQGSILVQIVLRCSGGSALFPSGAAAVVVGVRGRKGKNFTKSSPSRMVRRCALRARLFFFSASRLLSGRSIEGGRALPCQMGSAWRIGQMAKLFTRLPRTAPSGRHLVSTEVHSGVFSR